MVIWSASSLSLLSAAPAPRLRHVALVLLLTAPLVGFGACDDPTHGGSPLLVFESPALGLLGATDAPRTFTLRLPQAVATVEAFTLHELAIDGTPLVGMPGVVPGPTSIEGPLPALSAGRHRLTARATATLDNGVAVDLDASTWFELVDLDRPDDCEVLNEVECLLPYPSSRYLVPADTETGFAVEFPEGVMPPLPEALDSDAFGQPDGFSPATQVMMHFGADVDLERSLAPRQLERTRTTNGRSLQPWSPTLLLDVDDGLSPVLHFTELDIQTTDPSRQALFLRPAEPLTPGHRYIVAVRRLVRSDGSPIEPEPVFRALRDGRPTDIPGVEARRANVEGVLDRLRERPVGTGDLLLAFDFVVQSDDTLSNVMRAMRDDAYAWLAEQEGPTFEVFPFHEGPVDPEPGADVSREFACEAFDGQPWRLLHGRFETPLYLSSDPLLDRLTGGRLVDEDEDGLPERQGTMDANFSIQIPCAVLDPEGSAQRDPMLVGHGLFGRGRQVAGIAGSLDANRQGWAPGRFERITGGTDWLGLSQFDFDFTQPLAPHFIINSVLNDADNFGALPDRLQQGVTNTLVLARMLKEGHFNVDPAFRVPGGEGVFPGASAPLDYFGISLGGIMGLMTAALSPDLDRIAVDIAGSNFSVMVQRSSAIGLIGIVLDFLNPDKMQQALFFGLAEEMWDSAEPVAYLRHITRDPLPGSGAPKDVLMTVAAFDSIVGNEASESTARALGLPNLRDEFAREGSAWRGRQGIPDVATLPEEGEPDFVGALVVYDLGMYDLANPEHDGFVPPLGNASAGSACEPHGRSLQAPAVVVQITDWLDRGVIENTCDGYCDSLSRAGGFAPSEIEFGNPEPCDPLTAEPLF